MTGQSLAPGSHGRAILDSAVDFALIATGHDGRVLDWNSGAERLLGWSAAEMLGHPLDRIFTLEDLAEDRPRAETRLTLMAGRATTERWHRRKDATRIWVSCEARPLCAADGTHLGVLRILQDRTPQQRTQAAELADSRFLRDALQSSADCISVLDLDGRLIFMSQAGRRAMEVIDYDAIRGCSWTEFWQDADSPDGLAAVQAARAGAVGRVRRFAPTRAGAPRWWDVQITPMPGADGRPHLLLSVARDITVTRQATDAALRDAQGLNMHILGSSRDCIVVLDLAGNNLFVSPGGVEAMELGDVESIIGLSWLRVWSGADRIAANAAVAAAAAGRSGRFQGFCPTHKGTPKWWDVALSPLLGPDGRPERVLSVGRDITDQMLAAKRLAEAEARLRLAQEAVGLGTFETFVETDTFVASDQYFRLFGLTPRDPTPVSAVVDLILPQDLLAVSTYQTRLSGALAPTAEYRIRRADTGALRWIERQAEYLPGSEDRPARLIGIARDVTDRKNAELRQLALLDLADRVRSTQDITAMTLAAVELLGRTMDVSRAGFAVVDAARRQVTIEQDWCTGTDIPSLAGVHDMTRYGHFIEDLLRGETVNIPDITGDHRTKGSAATLRGLHVSGLLNVPLMDQGQAVALLFLNTAVVRRWTEDEIVFVRAVADRLWAAIRQSRAEAHLRVLNDTLEAQVAARTHALELAEARQRAMSDTTRQLISVIDPDGTLRDCNRATLDAIGAPLAELVGQPFWDTPWFARTPGMAALIKDAVVQARAGKLMRFEVVVNLPDNSQRTYDFSMTPVRAASGQVIEVVPEATDISEQRRMEDQLRQSQKMEAVGQLTGGLAHDFNNLLTSITGSLELLQARLIQGRLTDLDRYINAAQGAAKRAAALTHRLLAFSRRQTLDPKPVDINRLVSGMEDLIRRTVGPAVSIEVVGAKGLWTTLIDPGQLENALLNLCINARDAMPDGGQLTIETANKWLDERTARERDLPPGQYLSLSVTDTGSGMPPEIIKRIFDPFYTTKPLGLGTGLGLSMVYGFARQSGGQVQVYSEVGLGTTMCLYMPRHYGAGASEEPVINESEAPRATAGQTVLVVDDEPTVRMLVTEVLEDLGYIAIEAADSAAGLKVLQSAVRIDLLISDVGLPGGMNGRQMADAARLVRRDLKILFITGYAENAAVGNGHLEPGMQVLTKPFAMEALARRIKSLITEGSHKL